MINPKRVEAKPATDDGLLCIDKPAGLTSHDVVREIRSISSLRRVGHTGTLDPLATGLLILCVGPATRLAEYLVALPKSYDATIRLGQETDTYDAEGDLVAEAPVSVQKTELDQILAQFLGQIEQIPPIYSAVKQDGQPLYKRARQGLKVTPKVRLVTIHEIELLSWESPILQLRVVCSSGTYIRSLAHDIGQQLDCGGHISSLRRTSIGPFDVGDAASLDELSKANWREFLHPTDTAVAHLSRLDLSASESIKLRQGQQLARRYGQPENDIVRAYDSHGRFIGIAVAQGEQWQPRKVLFH
jgi:tRNA pseudouridine55 synthase